MQIQISGQHMSVGMSLQEYVKNRLLEIVNKYFSDAPAAHVHFAKQSRDFICDIVVNEGTGRHVVIKSEHICDDVYSSFDVAVSKLEKQLRKYKSKLRDRSKRVKLSEMSYPAKKYTISTKSNEKILDEAEEFDVDNPVIIAEDAADVVDLSVGEAVMKMDLENLPALMFKNKKTGKLNIVYYRKDGNISWVDSNS